MKQDKISIFFALLQQGFQVTAKVGCDIQSLLCDQFGLMPDYLAHRISTIFLDGKPVDDVEAAMVRDGATLALSAAMPGLVGATFRRAGCLAAFRGSITYQKEDEAPAACYDGIITLKLFNLLVTEMGPQFLERGIWISGSDLRDVLRTHPSDIATIFKKIDKDGNGIDPDKIADLDWISPDAPYFLQATSEAGPTKTV
jgi:hypothetical protein